MTRFPMCVFDRAEPRLGHRDACAALGILEDDAHLDRSGAFLVMLRPTKALVRNDLVDDQREPWRAARRCEVVARSFVGHRKPRRALTGVGEALPSALL